MMNKIFRNYKKAVNTFWYRMSNNIERYITNVRKSIDKNKRA